MSDNCSFDSESIEGAMMAAFHSEATAPAMAAAGPMDQGQGEQEIDPTFPSRRRRSRRRQQRRSQCPPNFLLLALCVAAAGTWPRSRAFSSSSGTFSAPRRSRSLSGPFPSSPGGGRRREAMRMSSLAEPPPGSAAASASSTFQRRMKGLLTKRPTGAGGRTVGQRASDRPSNLQTVRTLMEYKDALDECRANDQLVVARFYATWCKACRAVQPAYHRMANLYPNVVFLEVPVTNENANLHQGLGVPSLPYGHVYHPEAGLVEELKISKKYFRNLVRVVRWYDEGECGLEEFVPRSIDDEA